MKKINIQKLTLRNFKCYESVEFNFSNSTNKVKGITGFGKTTIKDAFLWVLGFDCEFAPRINDFLVKNLETSVKLEIEIDGVVYNLERISKQKWKTNQDTLEEEYIGNEAKFSIDGQKLSATNYKEQLTTIFGVPTHFDIRVLSDLNFFNSIVGTSWTWKERRTYLFNLFPNIEEKVKELANNPKFECLKTEIEKGLDEIAIGKVLASEKYSIENALLSNKTIIADRTQTIKEYSSIDFNAIKKEISLLEQDLDDLKMQNLEDLSVATSKKNELENSIETLKNQIRWNEEQCEWYETQSKNLFETKLAEHCPTCNRKFEKSKLNSLKATFELDKMQKLGEYSQKLENCRNFVVSAKIQIETQEKELDRILTQILPNLKASTNIAEQSREIKQQILSLNQELAKEKLIEELEKQVEQYKQQNKSILNTQKNYVERKNALKQYVEEKISIITNEINKNFDGVSFKFFKYNTAKAETEYQPTCECLLNGISYKNLSQGQKIIADFNVNNGIQKLFDICVPQIVDNKQDNTFDMVSENQKIELITCQETNIKATFIKDIYTIDDCDIKGE